ncbi:hypothetical protein SARC_12520 [Sphaeroforma arctica JP610]|uniref:Uncharacterized protein n=1 Tax=Sphaeroforma arctica JP610 TaxID=667725 RepID=A0A0L0FFW4_9EUKA|nr:hypothetical protein SARC_12520 [Sphaeroforma arctica JP610]KNC74943.1 hypothetical protein SARC_12520 [Sphaeroforma arctica JP610]|eukprot:XP_014148845.1 hypothetical protein SARC_12520 [Sphaeroforma arctica JP610]
MASRSLVKVFLDESRDAQTSVETAAFSADNFVATLSTSQLEQHNLDGTNNVVHQRAAKILANQRNVAPYTPSDNRRTMGSDTSALPDPVTLSRPVVRQNPPATQPDSGIAGVATGSGDVPLTEAEKAQFAQVQEEDAMRQRIRQEARLLMAEEAARFRAEPLAAESTSGSSTKGSTTASSTSGSAQSLNGVLLASRASRMIDLAVLRLSTGMSEDVSQFCMVLRNGSNKAYAALAMVNVNISRGLLAQDIAEPALLEKVVPHSTFFLLLGLLSWFQQSWALYGPSKIKDRVSTKVKARVNNQQPKRPQDAEGQQAGGGGGHNGGKNAKEGGGQQQQQQLTTQQQI